MTSFICFSFVLVALRKMALRYSLGGSKDLWEMFRISFFRKYLKYEHYFIKNTMVFQIGKILEHYDNDL